MSCRKLIVVPAVAILFVAGIGYDLATTCSSTCPAPYRNRICSTTCQGTCCISACWDGQCYGDCTGCGGGGGGTASLEVPDDCSRRPSQGILKKLINLQASNAPLRRLVEIYQAGSGITIEVEKELADTTISGCWSGEAETVFDTVVGLLKLQTVKIGPSAWRIRSRAS